MKLNVFLVLKNLVKNYRFFPDFLQIFPIFQVFQKSRFSSDFPDFRFWIPDIENVCVEVLTDERFQICKKRARGTATLGDVSPFGSAKSPRKGTPPPLAPPSSPRSSVLAPWLQWLHGAWGQAIILKMKHSKI